MKSCKTPLWRVISFLTLCLPLVFMLAFSGQALAVCFESGFEDEDGNLSTEGFCIDTEPLIDSVLDWNDFAPIEWTDVINPFPYRTADEVFSGWTLTGLEDDQETNSDTAFAGGTKQDDECPAVKGGKAPNKDDLKRVYISSNTIDGDVFLNLAWVRIPQNTTSPSAHIGFEFNQGEIACGGNSDDLVERTVGDMLIVYDFEGGATDTPTITLRRWVDSGACEVGSNSPPCWGPSTNLTALGFAEARVNTSLVGPVTSNLAPPTPPATTSVADTLQLNEFGEAGINLTDAGVFDENVCLGFGTAFAVSRSSGNSAQAQMKDLVGPGDVNIANCGAVIIRKVTDPSPDATDTTFAYTTTGGLDPSTFSLKDGESQDYGSEVFAGSYSVTETDPGPNFEIQSVDCSASDTSHGTTIDTTTTFGTISFDLKAQDTVDCTYTNELLTGDITVSKTVVNACDAMDDGSFTLFIGSETKVVDGAGGSLFVDDLTPDDYAVGENDPGSNYDWSIGGDGDCADGSVTLDPDESISCTVTNIRRPTVTIVKEVTGGNPAIFDLIVRDGAVDHETEDQGNGGTTGAVVITTVKSGSGATTTYGPVLVGETADNGPGNTTIVSPIAGFQSYWSCTDTAATKGEGASVTLPELLPGEDVICTVTNIPLAAAACVPGS